MTPDGCDHALLVQMRTRAHNPRMERVIAAYSRLGEHGACWLALGIAGAVVDESHRRQRWLRGARVVILAYALNQALKLVVRRRRPDLTGLPPVIPTASSLSFPSAHATTSFAAAHAFRGLLPSAPLYAAAFAFALSRPYLGVHYPSDVLAGALLGTGTAGALP